MNRHKTFGILVVIAALLLALFYFRSSETKAPTKDVRKPAAAAPGPTRMPAAEPKKGKRAPLRTLSEARVLAAPDAAQGRFTGRVLNSGSNVPVPGAELVFSHEGSAESVRANSDGLFVFEPSELGRYQLAMASASGFFSYAPEWEASPISLVARAEISVEGIEVYLVPAIDYQGKVVDNAGQPVAGARISVSVSREGAMSAEEDSIESDEQGAFLFHARDFSLISAIKGESTGHAIVDQAVQISRRLVVVMGAEHATPRRMTHEHGGEEAPSETQGRASLRGKVVDAEGNAVPAFNLMVTAKEGLSGRSVAQAAVFDGRGEFEIGGLGPGAYRVHVAAAGWAIASAPATAAIGGGPSVKVQLGKGASVFGTVVDSESKEPLALAKVTMESSFGSGSGARPMLVSAVSDEKGEFELRALQPGRRSVVVVAANHHTKIVSALEVIEGERTGPLLVELAPVAEGEQPRLDLAGIGVALGQADGAMLVREVIVGGGAEEAGILPKDLIVAINGKTVRELGWDNSIQSIRGPVGTQLQIRVLRQEEEIEFTVTRRAIRN